MKEKVVVNNSSSGGIGFFGLLTIVFITLKLCGIINWSWLWVLSPLWISFLAFVIVLVGIFLVAGTIFLIGTLLTINRK